MGSDGKASSNVEGEELATEPSRRVLLEAEATNIQDKLRVDACTHDSFGVSRWLPAATGVPGHNHLFKAARSSERGAQKLKRTSCERILRSVSSWMLWLPALRRSVSSCACVEWHTQVQPVTPGWLVAVGRLLMRQPKPFSCGCWLMLVVTAVLLANVARPCRCGQAGSRTRRQPACWYVSVPLPVYKVCRMLTSAW